MARAVPWRFRWVAVAYLVLVVGVAVFVYLTTFGPLVDPDGGASFAGIWLFIVTLPASAIFISLDPPMTGQPVFAVMVAVGLAQAALLFLLFWWLDRRLAAAGS